MESDPAPIVGEGLSPRASPVRLLLSAAAVETVFAFIGLGTCVVWAWRDGGFAPEEWLPGGLLLLALVCTAAASVDFRRRLFAFRLPLVLFGLYVAWSYLSILWAQVPADAVDGANRTLVYLLIFGLFAGLGVTERVGAVLVLAWGSALAALGVIGLIRAGSAATAAHFVQGRLASPITYPDGDAALFLSACLPLLILASRRHANAGARFLACVAGVVLADLSVLCQSRGSLIWLPCALLIYLALTRSKLRAVAYLLGAAAPVAAATPALLSVYSAVVAGQGRSAAVTHAAAWIAVSGALAAVGLAFLLLFEQRVTLSARTRALIGTGLSALAVVAVIAAAAIASGSHPLGRAERAWRNFTTNQAVAPTEAPHFSSGLGTSRYDVWRIAAREFLAHPVTGVGADNYIVGYLRQRRTHETSRYPESIELRTFSETGIVGAALFLGFLGVTFFRAARNARRTRLPGLALACFAGATYWLLHASTDWFWELPALTGAGLALLAIAAAPPTRERSPTEPTTFPRVKVAAVGATALLLAGALAIPWASVSLVDAAVARGPSRSSGSLLDTAARLNPWSERPALARAALAANAGDRKQERAALHEALRRNPYDPYPYLILGVIDGREHRTAPARKELQQAHRLSPEDLVVTWAQRRLRWGNPVTQDQVNQILRG
jgi:O-Antigen ligase